MTDWLDAEQALVPTPGPRHRDILAGLLTNGVVRGNLVTDAHLAALAIEHGTALCSFDSDFARFDEVRWVNPGARCRKNAGSSTYDAHMTDHANTPVAPQEHPAHPTTRWPGLHDPQHSAWYIDRFRVMAARGDDLEGESRLVDALAPRRARLLDAGCGPGRHGGHLARLGHRVVGVDLDPALIEAARHDHPGATWLVADLTTLDLAAHGEPEPFDGALLAGNVIDFIPAEHRPDALARVAAHVRPGGFVLLGCRTSQGFTPDDLDAMLPDVGAALEHRFATWDLRPFDPGTSDFAVSVLRAR